MTEQIVMVGNYTYAWHGDTKLKVGDVVVLPPNWLFDHETEGTVTALGSSYTGPLTRIRKLARTKAEETARVREEKAQLKDHKHKILWQLSPFGDDNPRTTLVNVKLLPRVGPSPRPWSKPSPGAGTPRQRSPRATLRNVQTLILGSSDRSGTPDRLSSPSAQDRRYA